MDVQHFNKPEPPLMRTPSEPKELCQDCMRDWGRVSVLDPMYGCPVCDAPQLERDDTHDVYVRQIAAGVK